MTETKTIEVSYPGKNMPDPIVLFATGVTERWLYDGPDGAKIKTERCTFNGVPVCRARGAGLVGGEFEKNLIVDIPEPIATAVKSGYTLVAREHGLVFTRPLKGDFSGVEISTYAATVEIIGPTQEILAKVLDDVTTRKLTAATSRKDLDN